MSQPQAAISRASRTDARRAELLAAARRVIDRRGFAGATVGEITREAGASIGLLHYHFASKDEVVAEAFAELAGGELEELTRATERHSDPTARLIAQLELGAWSDASSWRIWIDGWGEAVHARALRETLADFQRAWRAVLARVLADGARDGAWECVDPADAAGRLTAMIDGIGLHATLHPEAVPASTAAAWARRAAELELGVSLPVGAAAVAPVTEPYEARIAIRGRDLDATGRVHPAVLLTYLGEAREALFARRLGPLGPPPRLDVAHVSADFRHVLTAGDDEVVVRCALERLGGESVRTRETISTPAGERVVSAGATVLVVGADGRPRALTDAEREALRR